MQTVMTATAQLDRFDNRKLRYMLLKNACPDPALRGTPVYGVRVELISDVTIQDSCEIGNITSQFARARWLLEALCRNTVTPCTLRDVVDDVLAQGLPDLPAVAEKAAAGCC